MQSRVRASGAFAIDRLATYASREVNRLSVGKEAKLIRIRL